MKKQGYEAHVFVCTHHRDGPRGCCSAKGSANFRDRLKKTFSTPEFKDRVRINASGCLDRCEEGITAVIYPQGRWFTKLTESDESLELTIREILKDK